MEIDLVGAVVAAAAQSHEPLDAQRSMPPGSPTIRTRTPDSADGSSPHLT